MRTCVFSMWMTASDDHRNMVSMQSLRLDVRAGVNRQSCRRSVAAFVLDCDGLSPLLPHKKEREHQCAALALRRE
jgi:hypothetical protein